ncbi:MAG: TolC family protein, partial [Desulfobulbaceae bacterium]|nr:TolC family protein [Desulfobulbaceae bacterium]
LGNVTLPPIITVPEDQLGGNFEIVQPLYKGSWLPRKEQANQSVSRDTEEYYQVVQNILFQVARIYYEVVKTKELVKLTREIVKLAEEEKRVAQVRFEEGSVTEDAVLNGDLKITSTRSKLIEYTNRLTLTKKILKRFIGKDIGQFDVLAPPALPMNDRDLPELIGTALESRHDYKKVQAMIDIAKADVKLAKSRFHPSLESSWGYFSVDNPSYYQDSDYWVFAVQLTIPIYEGGARFLDLKEKKENVIQAELAAKDFNNTIRLEVEEAMLRVKTNESVLVNLEKQEELAQKNYDIVFSKFKFGAAGTVDLNQAISTLDAVKTDLTVKKIDFQISLLKLEKIIGLFARDIIPAL